jgi:hypothetical protein
MEYAESVVTRVTPIPTRMIEKASLKDGVCEINMKVTIIISPIASNQYGKCLSRSASRD